MTASGKLRVAVLYGGRSGEHEVSLQSAASVINNLDGERFVIIPVAIDKQGQWLLNDVRMIQQGTEVLPVYKDLPAVVLPPNPAHEAELLLVNPGQASRATAVDVVFPVLHGPLGEDGTVQGLLELAEVPYVGCGVLASAVGMDKDIAKRLARDAGIPVVPWITLKRDAYGSDPEAAHATIVQELGFPHFVKPANMGSSVGVKKVRTAEELAPAIREAFAYDTKVLVEKAVDAREIEVAVLEPLDRETGEFYFNEINTLPGFTQISMYPKLWQASGIPYRQLLTHLIELAIKRHWRKAGLRREHAAG